MVSAYSTTQQIPPGGVVKFWCTRLGCSIYLPRFLTKMNSIFQKLFEDIDGYRAPRLAPERWEELKQFPVRQDDIFIVTFPKSGTTWMQQIVKLLRNDGKQDDVKLDRAIPWLETLDSELGKIIGYTADMATSSDVLSPRAFKSHLPYELVPGGIPHTTCAKYICVMRNPKDICVSAWHHLNNMMQQFDVTIPWEEHVGQFLKAPYAGWFDHVLGWWKHRDSQNILYVKYEDMKRDPLTTIRTVAKFIGIENPTDKLFQDVMEHSSLTSMKKDPFSNMDWHVGHKKMLAQKGLFIRKGEIGGWREQFSEEQSKRYDEIFKEKMSGTDLDFQFE